MNRQLGMALVYVVSLALHVGGGMALGSVERAEEVKRTVVEVRVVERKKPTPPPEAPPPPPAEVAPKAPPKAAPAPKPSAAPPPSAAPAASSAPDFGLSLAGVGGGGGPGGVAVPSGPRAEPVRQAARDLAPPPKPSGGCEEEEVRPKAVNMPRPAYTDEARAAEIEGKVRVELTVGADGKVTAAKVLAGLGHGLDEAALTAVKEASFEPATRCGKAVASTFTISVRFAL